MVLVNYIGVQSLGVSEMIFFHFFNNFYKTFKVYFLIKLFVLDD